MQRHRNIEIERIVVANARYEEHDDQQHVITETNSQRFRATFRCEQETLDGDKCKLQKCD